MTLDEIKRTKIEGKNLSPQEEKELWISERQQAMEIMDYAFIRIRELDSLIENSNPDDQTPE